MSVTTIVDERRSAKESWGTAQIKVTFSASSASHADRVQQAGQKCLDIMEEAVTGQKPMFHESDDETSGKKKRGKSEAD